MTIATVIRAPFEASSGPAAPDDAAAVAGIIAEGMESNTDFRAIRDLGIACGQGYFIARPQAEPPRRPPRHLVDTEGTPLGMLNRFALIDRFARPFRRELYGRKPCTEFMDANPLTALRGAVPLNEHADRLLELRQPFAACYFDISGFKPFNDRFGYRLGDQIIQMLGKLLRDIAEAKRDFVSHIGGDDFMVLFQSEDWEVRCACSTARSRTSSRSRT